MNDDLPKTDETPPKDPNVIAFPTLAERKDKEKQEQLWRAQYKKEKDKQERADKAARMVLQARGQGSKQPFFNFGKIPPFTRTLLGSFLLIHLVLFFVPDGIRLFVYEQFGFTPAVYTIGLMQTHTLPWGAFIAPLTHAFIHGGWMHLLFNSVMLLSLGMFFEKVYGAKEAALFFFACTLAGALFYMAFAPFSPVPMIGASGGLSGFFSVGLLLMFAQRTGRPLDFKRFDRQGPWPTLVLWGAVMLLPSIVMGNVAWQAHLGGYLCGLALFMLRQKRL